LLPVVGTSSASVDVEQKMFLSLDSSLPLLLVNDMDSILAMQRDVEAYLSSLTSDFGLTDVPVIGLDCEWRPENFYAREREKRDALSEKSFFSGRKRAFFKRLWLRFWRRRDDAMTAMNGTSRRGEEEYQEAGEEQGQEWGGGSDEAAKKLAATTKKKNKSKGVSNPVSLLQIASREKVWILDMQSLCRKVHPGKGGALMGTTNSDTEEVLEKVLSSIMSSKKVIKLGMGPTGDIKRLGWSYPWLSSTQVYRGVLDVFSLAKKSYEKDGVSSRELEGLNKLCVRQLGRGIDKSLQCSDWSFRPLSREQLHYAALDAFVLIDLFDSLLLKLASRDVKNQGSSPKQLLSSLMHEYTLTYPTTLLASSPVSQKDTTSVRVSGEDSSYLNSELEDIVVQLRTVTMQQKAFTF